MLLEQIVTAGTVTEICVWRLVRGYRRLLRRRTGDEESGRKPVGRLRIGYYRPLSDLRKHTSPSSGSGHGTAEGDSDEPVKSHLKLTVVDGYVTVLGSGNMDRASWYTSQELGVAFLSRDLAALVLGRVRNSLGAGLAIEGRVEEYFSG